MLFDQQLSTSHTVMKMLLKSNDDLWSDDEWAALMEWALGIYLSKQRKNVLAESGAEPPAKKQRESIEIDIIGTDSDEEDELDDQHKLGNEDELDEDQD